MESPADAASAANDASAMDDQDMMDGGGGDNDDNNDKPADDDDDDAADDAAAARRQRASLAPRAASAYAAAAPLRNPSSLTVPALMSWLTSIDVELSGAKKSKQFYVDLLYATIGQPLQDAYPKEGGKKGGKK